jgi:hypothetical protein
MTIKELSQAHRTLVPSSTRKPQRVVRGWPKHYPNVIHEVQWGVVNSATVDATKFVGPHKSHMRQYTTQCLLQHGPTDTVLNQHRQGLPHSKL